MTPKLDKEGSALLHLLLEVLRDADPEDPRTFITYTEAHKRLNIPILGGHSGRSLQKQGMTSLGAWAEQQSLPAITGLIVREADHSPGPGYFTANGKHEIEDIDWWISEIRRAKELDWEDLGGSPTLYEKEAQRKLDLLLNEARRIAALIEMRVAVSNVFIDRKAPTRSAPDDLISTIQQLLNADPLICYLCGGIILISPKNRLLQPSPDRIDSSVHHYGPENMRLAHLACNLGKNAASVSEFGEWLRIVRSGL